MLLHNSRVSRYAIVENAILDKNVVVMEGATLGVDKEHDRARGFVVSDGGVTVVGKGKVVLPAPADPTTTVSRRPAPAISRSCSTGLVTSVAGSVGGRNFVTANRALGEPPRPADALSATKRTPRSSRPAQAMAVAAALTTLIVAAAQSLAIASSPGSPSDGR